jgi:CubicO group peptidase (beta-lactamase class C family)
MSSLRELINRAFEPVQAALNTGSIPGAVLGLVTQDGAREVRHAGRAQVVPEEVALVEETVFDLASLTKVIFTTTQILEAAANKELNLDDPLTALLPDFRQYDQNCWERAVTFRQCLGHQTPFPAVEPLYTYGQDQQTLRAFILQRRWPTGPNVYSDINYILLGLALERLRGRALASISPGWGFTFHPTPQHCAATEQCALRSRVMRGEVHDENAYALGGAGHAGLFGSMLAVLDFASDLLAGQNVSGDTVTLMQTPLSDTRTHGWQRTHPGWSGGDTCSGATIGHTGFTGTGLWIDFDRGLAWSLLTNRVHPSRHTDSGIAALRIQVGEIIGGSAGGR